MAEMFHECGMPDNVFQVATGDGATGAALVAGVDCIMFTGSTRTGKLVAKAAAEALIPCHLELGGKDPMIVCADADVEKAATAAAFYSMNNSGQVCISVERVYVEEPIYDEFVSRVTEKVKKLRQGAPSGPGSVDVGAIIFPPQIETIDAHVRDAVEKGAKVLVGGHVHEGSGSGGHFYEPTVLVDVDHTMETMREETFGPVLPIMKVADVDEAVRLANDSIYGLQASVWTRDTSRGEQIARRLESGAVCVNAAQINYFALNLPMGGWKSSGISSRHGISGIRKYCRVQSLLVSGFGPRRELFMFPYSKRATHLLARIYRTVYGHGRRGR
jgi:acyl-CoA reductase-like NAD-dependent aldehyde dehydrogenase